jgi:hypothetical protein
LALERRFLESPLGRKNGPRMARAEPEAIIAVSTRTGPTAVPVDTIDTDSAESVMPIPIHRYRPDGFNALDCRPGAAA